MGLGELGLAYQESQAAFGCDQAGGDRQDRFEALDCAEGDHVEGRAGQGFGAGGLYIDVRQCKGAGDLFQECGFFVVGFDEGKRDLRRPEFDGDAGESGAGAYVGHSDPTHHRGHRGTQRKEVAGGEEAFAEVAGDDFFFVADGGEIHAGIPALEYIDVRRYIREVVGR